MTEEQLAAVVSQQEETILPKVRGMDGFKGVLSLVDRESGKAISVTLWETEDAMAASEADADTVREQSADIADSTVGGVERYSVAIIDLP